MINELQCPSCKGRIIQAFKIGYVHDETTCSLSDGLMITEIEENSGIFEILVKDIQARKFFLNKVNEILGTKSGLNVAKPLPNEKVQPVANKEDLKPISAIRHKKLGDLVIEW